MIRAAALASVVLLGVLAAPALADIRFEGRTSQGGSALVVAEDDGVPKRGAIKWRGSCRRPGARIQHGTGFSRPLDLATRRRFRDSGTYRHRVPNGLRLTVTTTISGRKVGPRRWAGRFRAVAVVRRGGRVRDRCSVRGVRWSVRR